MNRNTLIKFLVVVQTVAMAPASNILAAPRQQTTSATKTSAAMPADDSASDNPASREAESMPPPEEGHICDLPPLRPSCYALRSIALLVVKLAEQGTPGSASAAEQHCERYLADYGLFVLSARQYATTIIEAGSGSVGGVLDQVDPDLAVAAEFCAQVKSPTPCLKLSFSGGTAKTQGGSIGYGAALQHFRNAKAMALGIAPTPLKTCEPDKRPTTVEQSASSKTDPPQPPAKRRTDSPFDERDNSSDHGTVSAGTRVPDVTKVAKPSSKGGDLTGDGVVKVGSSPRRWEAPLRISAVATLGVASVVLLGIGGAQLADGRALDRETTSLRESLPPRQYVEQIEQYRANYLHGGLALGFAAMGMGGAAVALFTGDLLKRSRTHQVALSTSGLQYSLKF